MTNALLGLGIGLVTCLGSWWIVTRYVRPELQIVPEISKLPDDSGAATWRYRVKVLNRRRRFLPHRPAVDLHVSAVLRVKGLHEEAPQTWYSVIVPVGRTGDLSYMKWNVALRLRLHDIPAEQTRLFPEAIRNAISDGTVELEDLFDLGSRAQLRVVLTAAHSYTFGRTFALQRFSRDTIKCGPFPGLSPRVNEEPGGDDDADIAV